MGHGAVVAVRLYYECPAHGLFTVRAGLGEKWLREKQCPHCGALSRRDHKMTSVVHDEAEQG